jgi:broad specificity phosphatase PhoE
VIEPPFGVREPFWFGLSDVTHVTLVRHAQQDYPDPVNFDPSQWTDPPLSATGREQALAVGRALADDHIDVVLASSLSRAQDTARAIAEPHGLPVIIGEDVHEIESFRDLEAGQNPKDHVSAEEWAERTDRYRLERRWDLMPFSESSAEWFAAILADYPGQRIVLVTHGGVINSVLAGVLGLDEDLFFLPAHASLSTVAYRDGIGRLRSINEHRYIPEGILTL